jgi:uncharacterized beta barrel domain-containing protein DUF5777
MMKTQATIAALLTAVLAAASPALGQTSTPQAAPANAAQQTPSDDLTLNLAEPDFTLAALPTTLRLPRNKMAFRVTHRFSRPLGRGDFGSLAEDFFGLDLGAQIGLELRYGLRTGTQVGINRTSDRTIQFFAQHELLRQASFPLTIDVLGVAEGTNNFRDSYSPGLGAVVSRTIGDVAALYVQPVWLNNTNPLPSELDDHNDSMVLGLGARVRIRPTVYLVAEGAPRVAGYDPAVTHLSFGLEKRAGGHLFQLNFSNSFGTTFGQIARGGTSHDDWYLGFNITRKFY